jgi:hypothetical protein
MAKVELDRKATRAKVGPLAKTLHSHRLDSY